FLDILLHPVLGEVDGHVVVLGALGDTEYVTAEHEAWSAWTFPALVGEDFGLATFINDHVHTEWPVLGQHHALIEQVGVRGIEGCGWVLWRQVRLQVLQELEGGLAGFVIDLQRIAASLPQELGDRYTNGTT